MQTTDGRYQQGVNNPGAPPKQNVSGASNSAANHTHNSQYNASYNQADINQTNLEFGKNVIKGIGIIIWRPFRLMFRFAKRNYTYYVLKLEQTKAFNTSLRSLANALFIIVFAVSAILLYRGGQISLVKMTLVEQIGEWSSVAGVNVQEVKLHNRKHSNKQDILAALDVKIGTPLLSFDVDAARKRIEKLGWIERADVQRIFPDRLDVSIVERNPYAIWQINGKHYLVDKNGVLVADEIPEGYQYLPLIVGKGAATEALGLLSALEERLEILDHVRALVRVGERRWDIDFINGIRVLLPAAKPEAMLADLERMIVDQKIFERGINIIDFRLSDRVRFRMDDATAEAYHAAKDAEKNDNN
ncbi:MAG: FtsQ-type POTRA domain-containing protein [Rhizobiales bacterium]|nr:FtsQ-type POTRA domain-containing protein [Hyphomicrobiales bacterium]NRB13991.1 FtsQ-type POTRA domain-containing protein [Hyphomicrobiales bacterium]